MNTWAAHAEGNAVHRLRVAGLGFRKYVSADVDVGGCQNYGPFLGTLNIRGRIILGIQKGTIILTTNHVNPATHHVFLFKTGSRSSS